MKKLACAASVLVLVALSVPPAEALKRQCRGSMSAVTVSGDLEVSAGDVCVLIGTTVTGNVTVRGILFAFQAQILGSLIGIHAHSIGLNWGTVGGNLIADHTSSGPNLLCDSSIEGNVIIQHSSLDSYWQIGPESSHGVAGCTAPNTVGGNLIFQNNLGDGDISDNQIGGNLDCHNNTPPPDGANNTVGGNKQGQCAGF
jgi:hypothetical protein